MFKWKWVCDVSGNTGISHINGMKQHPVCPACRDVQRIKVIQKDVTRKILRRGGRSKYGRWLWVYECSCGNVDEAIIGTLRKRDKCPKCMNGNTATVGEKINGRVVLGRADKSGKWNWRCPRCEKKGAATLLDLRSHKCRCSKKIYVRLRDRWLTLKDLCVLSGRCEVWVRIRLKEGWSPLEIILGQKENVGGEHK